MSARVRIGVFDSGVGGQSVASAIQKALPDSEITLRQDKQHMPYGNRQPSELLGFVTPIFEEMVAAGCEVIVVACNTVSTTIIEPLRAKFSLPLIAVEPLIEAAALATKTGIIAVCATPSTLASNRYAQLRHDFAQSLQIIEPDCSQWAAMIETDRIDHNIIRQQVENSLEQNADVIVLGCTHYHWIEAEIKQVAGSRAAVIQPEPVIIEELKRVLARLA